MVISQDTLQDLTKCTVAIQNPDNGKVLGTGVIVTDDGSILTCYHVLENIISNTKTVSIRFPTLVKTKMQADIVQESYDQSLDIAFLKLQTKQPDRMIAANLSEMVSPTHPFIGFGFKKAQEFDGLHVNGEIQGKAHKTSRDGTISPSLIQLQSHQIAPGMSGSAILDTESNKVIGIVSERYRTQDDAYKDLSFGIPVESIIKVYPSLREENPGLVKFNNFIQLIGKSESFIHKRFEDVYVPPIEYDEIEKTLKEHRCIFITGSAEYGKTYTAINLLWEFYKNNNHAPRYIEEGSKDTNEIISKLVNQDKSLENNIIYIEDPVGKTEYTRNKEFEESIGSVISGLSRLNAYLVVTMREEIYQKFNPIGKDYLKQYIKKLNIANHSYDSKRRKEMLSRWATAMNCKWFQDDNLRKIVLEYIENDETKLSTPLNIKDFTSETAAANNNILNKEKLLEIVNKQSQRTPERFARDIKEMTESGEIDKILFLCFPFISEGFSTYFVKTEYNKLLKDKDFNIKNGHAFERASTKFQDKIEVGDHVRFSHPSYSQALPYLLLENGSPSEINTEIFSNVLIKLSNIDGITLSDIASAIINNFDKLPDKVQNILFNLADNRFAGLSFGIASNFDKLPDKVQNLLFRLADNKETALSDVAPAVKYNFDNLPENVRDELLLKVADSKYAPSSITLAMIVHDNFDKLPDKVRNELLIKLVDEYVPDYVANYVADAVANNFDNLPEKVQKLLFKLADSKYAATSVASAITYNFDKLPENVRNELLLKLADSKYAVKYLSEKLAAQSDKLPQHIRNKLFKGKAN